MNTTDRFTLGAITAAAVLAAFLASTWLTTYMPNPGPILTWAFTYIVAVVGLAKAVHLPPARVLFAATLLLAHAVVLLLVGLRHVIDGLLVAFSQLSAAGTAALAHSQQKAAWSA